MYAQEYKDVIHWLRSDMRRRSEERRVGKECAI